MVLITPFIFTNLIISWRSRRSREDVRGCFKGLADDPIKYFAADENQDLGIVKSVRKPRTRLIIAPFPKRPQKSDEFFFNPNSQIPLTTAIQA